MLPEAQPTFIMSNPPALTTTFTPSPSCLSYQYATSKTINYATSGPPNYGPNLVVNLGPPTDYSTCFPSGWATDSLSYFSPGICPSGYTSACSTLGYLPPITSGETTVICCPSDYTCGTYPPPWVCMSSFLYGLPTTLDLYTAGSISGSYTAAFGGVNAFSVQIRFQATDFVSTTSSNPHATGAVTDAQSPSLSTGAKAGIGVGVVIGVLALLLLGALLLRQRGRKPKTEQTQYGMDTKQELDGTSYATPKVKDVSPPVVELDALEPYPDFTYSQPGTRIRDPIASGSFPAGGAEPHTQANLTSTEPSPLVVPHARSEDAVELPRQVASREVNSSVAYSQELAGAMPETRSAASAPHEARLREVEGEHDIQQQLKRIREEKERLTRINELERLEAELQERLAGPTST
ncbi:hypothetical protein NA56DRAFT_97492 [Hyaloscypha hepaticicola]|uniref:Uncharacterized protein n=1 Tax=Hyaloscypha hepaticicola TaxID=2082293 RepID=A0A2J6Q7L5_9HELO|nr:hypothetical protein NA56DRAFT_97492 [Hyaloscypha hepaticicola]